MLIGGFFVLCALFGEPSSWKSPTFGATSTATSKHAQSVNSTKNAKANLDEVATVEYQLSGINLTLSMKQEWWHSREPSAGANRKHAVPTWEHGFVVADFLTRHRDPWAATGKMAALRAETEPWKWSQRMLIVVFGAEIGLITTSGALIGASVLTLDPSIRLLEAAKKNLHENVAVPEGQKVVAFRKAMWGVGVELKRLTAGQFSAADVVVLNHASCESMLIGGMLQSALSVSSVHTLILVGFQGKECEGLRALKDVFEVERVRPDQLHPELTEVTLLALKRKPTREASDEDLGQATESKDL